MKTITFNKTGIILIHVIFWICSFNLFDAFFSRGIESGYVLEDLNLTAWDMLLISNSIIVFILAPFIWYFKNIKKQIKWGVTGVLLAVILLAIILPSNSKEDSIFFAVVFMFFLDNFLYVLIFHLTIIAAVYVNSGILIRKYFSQGKFTLYLGYVISLAVISGLVNYAIFNFCIDKIFPQLFYISWFKIWELIFCRNRFKLLCQ